MSSVRKGRLFRASKAKPLDALLVAAAVVGLLAFGIISAVFQISASLKAG